jgi:hypothetical protein
LFVGIFRLTISQSLRALILVVVLEAFDRLAVIQRDKSGLIGLTPKLDPFLPRFLEDVRISEEASVTLLATLVQVAAVFLGLYFAAVSPVFSAYAQAAAGVRYQLMEEMIRNGYISLVAFFAAVSTLLLAETAFGMTPGPSSILVATVIGIVGVLSFVPLGVRTFFFYDPIHLGHGLPQRISRWMVAATPERKGWNTEALQSYYYRNAKSLLDIVGNILGSAIARPSSPDGVARLANRSLFLLRHYTAVKTAIPSESDWFPKVLRHPIWERVSNTVVELALTAPAAIQPEKVPNLYWFEDQIGQQVTDAVGFLLGQNDSAELLTVLDTTINQMQFMGERWEIPEALRLQAKLGKLLQDHVDSSDTSAGIESAQTLAILERSSLLLIAPVIGFMAVMRSWSIERFATEIENLDWERHDAIFRHEYPRAITDALVDLRRKLLFELEVEGDFISPIWYRQQAVAGRWVRFLYASVDNMLKRAESTFGERADALISAKRHLAAAAVIDRGREAWMKSSILLGQTQVAADQLEAFRVNMAEPWPQCDWSLLESRTKTLKRRLNFSLAKCLPHLQPAQEEHTDRPDYFGMARFVLTAEAFEALEAKDEELFTKAVEPLIRASLVACAYLLNEYAEAPLEVQLIAASEPLAGLVDLSGYAVIYSELDETRFGQIARAAWDSVFAATDDPTHTLRLVQWAVFQRDHNLKYGGTEGIRTHWQMALERRLREEGLLGDLPFSRQPRAWRNHPSAIVRAISGPLMTLRARGTTVFDVIYLRDRPEQTEVPLSRAAKEFAESLAREVAKGHGSNPEDDEWFQGDCWP